MGKYYKGTLQISKALSDATRLEIINMLADGEMCACKILESFDITQPTLSYHMKILTDCGLINSKRDGAWMRYSLKKETFEMVRNLLNDFCECINQN